MQIIAPQGSFDMRIADALFLKAIPREMGKTISGSANIIALMNVIYTEAESTTKKILASRDATAWIHIAYMEIERWTLVYREKMLPEGVSAPASAVRELAPVGRYGWRYVIDLVLPWVGRSQIRLETPAASDIDEIFTLLTIMSTTSEYSNFLHYFGAHFPDISLDCTSTQELLAPEFLRNPRLQQWMKYLLRTHATEEHPDLSPNMGTKWVAKILDEKFVESEGFRVEAISRAIFALRAAPELTTSIVLHSLGYIEEWISDLSGIPKVKVGKILNFISLSQSKINVERNFLQKSQMQRMVNYAAVILPSNSNLESLYSDHDLTPHIVSAKKHILLSFPMFGEWCDIFINKLITGRRHDLKATRIGSALSQLEQHYTTKVFEPAVVKILEKWGLRVVWSVQKTASDNKRLPCGEIDAIAWDAKSGTLILVECKVTVPMTDFRSLSQQYNDYFESKKYHEKFLKKIDWLLSNIGEVKLIFKRTLNVEIEVNDNDIGKLMVTRTPAITRLIVDEYQTCTYWELDQYGPFENFRSQMSE